MGWLLGTLLAFTLASLLTVTTPIGTGEGIHKDELLHPVFPHSHLIDGRIVRHDELDNAAARSVADARRPVGVTWGASAGGDAVGLGVAFYPNVPEWLLLLPTVARGPTAPPNLMILHEFLDSPPDPPPDLTR